MSNVAALRTSRWRPNWAPLALGAIAAAAVSVAVLDLSPLKAAAAGAGCIMAGAIVRQPFLGLVLLVATLEQNAWARAVGLRGGQITPTDILTFLTLAGVVAAKRESLAGRRLPEDLALRIAALFGLVVMLSGVALQGTRGLRGETLKLIGFIVLMFLIVHLTNTTRRARVLVLAVLITIALSSAVAVSDHYLKTNLARLGSEAPEGAPSDPSRQKGSGGGVADNAAKSMACGTALAAILFLRDRRWRLLTGGAAVLGLLAVPTTAGRAGMLALGLGFVWLVFKYRRHRRFGVVLVLVPIALAATIAMVPSHSWDRLERLTEPTRDSTTAFRLAMFAIGLDLFAENPVLGVGPGKFKTDWLDFEYRWVRTEDEPKVMHNAYLGVLVEYGIFALIAFLTLLWLTWRGLHWAVDHGPEPEQRWLAEAMEFALVLYLFTANTGAGQRKILMWVLIGVSLAVARCARVSAQTPASRPAHPSVASMSPAAPPAAG